MEMKWLSFKKPFPKRRHRFNISVSTRIQTKPLKMLQYICQACKLRCNEKNRKEDMGHVHKTRAMQTEYNQFFKTCMWICQRSSTCVQGLTSVALPFLNCLHLQRNKLAIQMVVPALTVLWATQGSNNKAKKMHLKPLAGLQSAPTIGHFESGVSAVQCNHVNALQRNKGNRTKSQTYCHLEPQGTLQ